MKKTTISMIAIGLAVTTFTAFAQDTTSTPTATPSAASTTTPEGWRGKGGPGEGPMQGALDSLTPAEREQFKAAHQKAMQDPTVAEAKKKADTARKESFEARKNALIKQDASLASILEKVQTPGDMKNLTAEERQKVQTASKAARKGGEMEPKRAPQEKDFRDALRTAMLKADPTIGPVLDKVDSVMKNKRAKMMEEHDKNNPEQL